MRKNRINLIFILQMLIEYTGEGAQCQAAKLLEVIVLQYRGHLDQVSRIYFFFFFFFLFLKYF